MNDLFLDGNIQIINCDMFDECGLSSITDCAIDAIITDFPYGTLNKRNGWDKVIDYEEFWRIVNKKKKENAPVISTAQMPFTAFLVSTNYRDFKYTLVWEKSKATGYLNAKKQPLRAHEDIVVFYKKQCCYNPQMTQGTPYNKGKAIRDTFAYGKQKKAVLVKNDTGMRYPRSVQYFVTAESEGKHHPTQKPIALFEWLIRTYTNPGDLVVDPCMGSGTTALAAIRTGRKFLGYEKEPEYYEKAKARIIEEVDMPHLLDAS
ncbi:DNA-methyltransferase [Faecalicatena contorta]|uniref:DNA-methyltransferase n=1 Tax=Lachnospiraceae TaxID=186803 RepID=UPI001F3A751C|nr:site-specific DNA-methyltransferase [Faecalicatena contorta]MCF2668859.1 site-specific DNA-methyltransferase [Faecalicatena contorta]